ncbi:unnamed protein product [Symbiodinium sp. CCMP2592]|nr:unnamed protein product [Symbiodinium sp. CCMP2592]
MLTHAGRDARHLPLLRLGCGFAGLPPEAVLVTRHEDLHGLNQHKIQTGHLLVALNGVETKDLTPETFRPGYVTFPFKFRTVCLVCEEKAKAVEKVETQVKAATAIQALVVALLAKAPAWRPAGLRMGGVLAFQSRDLVFHGDRFEVTLADAELGYSLGMLTHSGRDARHLPLLRLGCGFAGLPPEPLLLCSHARYREGGRLLSYELVDVPRHKIETGHLLVALNGVETKDLETFRPGYVTFPFKFRTVCLVCEEKAKAVEKVETQAFIMSSYLMICVDAGGSEHPSKVVVLLAKALAWRHTGLLTDEVLSLF